MPQNLSTKDWSAWRNMMPPGPHSLHVIGTVTFPTTGYKARLQPNVPQGINPGIFVLDLVITPPPEGEMVGNVVTDFNLHYQEVTDVAYTEVTIHPINNNIPVRLVF